MAVIANTEVSVGEGAGQVVFSNTGRLSLICGPCQMESRDHAFMTAGAIKEICDELGVPLVYKSSFDKANRTSISGRRGIGLDAAMEIFADLKTEFGFPVLTDIHTEEQCALVAETADILQIPAFLCRQTDLLVAAAKTGRVINVKKGQFLAPWDMKNVQRARCFLRLQHVGLRHALAADHGRSGRSGRLRCNAFSAAAGRAGRLKRWPAGVRRNTGTRSRRSRCGRCIHRGA
jgi:3-deoxy-D-manno-octulosonic acid (KDO) 8-phosphate synthase